MPNEVKFDSNRMTWTQVAQDRKREIKGQRTISLPLVDDSSSVYEAVEDFVRFVAGLGGDPGFSVLAAMDDLQQIATDWMAKVESGTSEAEIQLAGSQLKRVVELYKTLQSYYEYEYRVAGD